MLTGRADMRERVSLYTLLTAVFAIAYVSTVINAVVFAEHTLLGILVTVLGLAAATVVGYWIIAGCANREPLARWMLRRR